MPTTEHIEIMEALKKGYTAEHRSEYSQELSESNFTYTYGSVTYSMDFG